MRIRSKEDYDSHERFLYKCIKFFLGETGHHKKDISCPWRRPRTASLPSQTILWSRLYGAFTWSLLSFHRPLMYDNKAEYAHSWPIHTRPISMSSKNCLQGSVFLNNFHRPYDDPGHQGQKYLSESLRSPGMCPKQGNSCLHHWIFGLFLKFC